ncbi:MAG: thioredoxin family protein [Akkermansiaceae bacterium]|jgi:thioredoxin-related protein|nr:thioredoxin family protein [Akkermansiaceae bacterium]
MKAITFLAAFTIGSAAIISSAFASVPEGWSTDLDKGFAEAKKADKFVLAEFTGSDWCPPCIAMRKNVFSKKEFIDAAAKHFVLVELDFPRGDKETAEKNQPLAEKYKIDAFPTVVIFDSAGKEVTRFTASQYPSIDAFLAHLDKVRERSELD